MSKGQTTTTNTQADPATRAYTEEARRRALAAASQPYSGFDPARAVAGLDPASREATANYGDYAGLGLAGFNALAGGDRSMFVNPYLDEVGGIFGHLREGALSTVNDAATRARAFGGSRHGVASGQALADIGRQEAGFRYGAFNDAMGRAAQAAGLGLQANAGLAGQGTEARNVEQARRAAELARFLDERGWGAEQLGLLTPFLTPTGQSTRQRTPSDWWSTVLGLGGLAAPFLFGPAGAAGGLAVVGDVPGQS